MKPRILILGDVMLDRYLHGSTKRTNPEVPGGTVFNVERVEDRLGGAAAVAYLCAGLGAAATLCGSVGHDAEGQRLIDLCEANGVKWCGCLDQP